VLSSFIEPHEQLFNFNVASSILATFFAFFEMRHYRLVTHSEMEILLNMYCILIDYKYLAGK